MFEVKELLLAIHYPRNKQEHEIQPACDAIGDHENVVEFALF